MTLPQFSSGTAAQAASGVSLFPSTAAAATAAQGRQAVPCNHATTGTKGHWHFTPAVPQRDLSERKGGRDGGVPSLLVLPFGCVKIFANSWLPVIPVLM